MLPVSFYFELEYGSEIDICIYFEGVIKLQDTYENYVGKIIKNECIRRRLTVCDVSNAVIGWKIYLMKIFSFVIV